MRRSFDISSIRKMASGPGVDTRTWVSYATVDEETDDSRSVAFDPDLGPLVKVTLHNGPNRTISCRVAAGVSGAGTGEWSPLIAKQEVLVVIPGGMTSDYGVIVAALPNKLDPFPTVVGGQDVTLNNFSFKRIRTPHVLETASAYLFRNAVTGSQLGLDDKGQIVMNDGDGNQFFMGADAVGFLTPDKKTALQILPADNTVFMQADGASFTIATEQSKFLTSGALQVVTSGSFGDQHAVSLEQVATIVTNAICMLLLPATGFLSPVALLTPPTPATITAFMAAALAACNAPTPAGPAPGGANPGIVAAVQAALAVPPIPSGLVAGAGKPNFLI